MKERYIPNMYRMKKLGDKYLLISEQGGWALLSKKEHREFLRHEPNPELLKLLKDQGIIVSEDNIDEILHKENKRRGFMKYPPGLHIVLPTLRCNHQCVYCHSSASTENQGYQDMDRETAKKVVDFIMSTPAKKIKIEYQGGDALLNFETLKIIYQEATSKAREKGKELMFSVVTNLTLITQESLDWLKDKKINITTSLDGPKEVHDANRKYTGGQGTYDDVIRKLKWCKENGKKVGALMVTTRYSLDKGKDIVDEYLKQGIHQIQLKYLNKIGFAEKEWKEIGYNADEYIKFWKESMEHIINKNIQGEKMVERLTQLIIRKIMTKDEPGFLDFRNPCGIITGQIAYNYNGDIYTCDEGRGFDLFNLGNVKTTSYEDIMKRPETHKLIELSMLETSYCDSCIYKPYCGPCPVISYATQNNIVPKLAKSDRCKIFKAQFDWVFDKILNDEKARKILFSWVKITQI